MDLRKIKKLIQLLEKSGLDELELREGEESVRLRRSGVVDVESTPSTSLSPEETEAPEEEQETGHQVRSPMVGIYYSSPKPDSPPFVEIGKTVRKGDVLCIIEAMKVMNHIEADADGTVARTFLENGAPVEYQQTLFLLR